MFSNNTLAQRKKRLTLNKLSLTNTGTTKKRLTLNKSKTPNYMSRYEDKLQKDIWKVLPTHPKQIKKIFFLDKNCSN